MMRSVPSLRARVARVIVGLAVPLSAQAIQNAQPCARITAACAGAGFTQGGASSGAGLQVDCVNPIMQGIAQPAAAARPLPQVPSQVVAACQAANPRFGQGPKSAAGQAPAPVAPNTPNAGATTVAAGNVTPSADGQLVHDGRLHVSWLSDANLAAKQTFGASGINKTGSMDYETAVRWVQGMNAFNNGAGYLGHNNWQLPTTPDNDPSCEVTGRHGESFGFHCAASALASLYYSTFGLQEPNTAVPIPRNTAGPFSDFQPYLYWSKSPAADPKQGFVSFSFNTGFQGANVYRNHLYVLPMIKGSLSGAPPRTGTGLQVNPGGLTVYDPVSDVTWLADANRAAKQTFGITGISPDGSMDHNTAVLWIQAMNQSDHGHGYLGQTRWDLPETGPADPSCSMKGTTGFDCAGSLMGALYYKQLRLIRGESVVSTPDVNLGPFHNVQPYLYWACSAETVRSPCRMNGPADGFEWNFSFGDGFQGTNLERNYLYVIVYFPD